MGYKVNYTTRAMKILQKMDNYDRNYIEKWIRDHLIGCIDPRKYGKNLVGSHTGMWRYRAGNYRIITEINDKEVIILVVKVGHRKDVYK